MAAKSMGETEFLEMQGRNGKKWECGSGAQSWLIGEQLYSNHCSELQKILATSIENICFILHQARDGIYHYRTTIGITAKEILPTHDA